MTAGSATHGPAAGGPAARIAGFLREGDARAAAGDERAAAAYYRAALQGAGRMGAALPASLHPALGRAQARCAQYARAFEASMRDALAAADAAPLPGTRFAAALANLLGQRPPYPPQPKQLLYPEMPTRQFYDRAAFGWTAGLEARTGAIRAEALAVARDAFAPYVTASGNRPEDAHHALVDDDGWSAYYLHRDGERVDAAAETCPETMAALEAVPLTDMPGRAPNVLFSRLKAGARIPPHNGLINTRLICHLPLVVPEKCGLRVGWETRAWREGETLIFDDTIEHEAWNESGEDRIVLLFEAWQPELSERERRQVAALMAAVDAHGQGGGTR